jgi:CRP-like cAMP-binding protein
MFKTLLGWVRTKASAAPGYTASWNLDAQEPLTSADAAAEMLRAPTALMQLGEAEAKVVVQYMEPRMVAEDTVLFQEGDHDDTDFMLLVISGEVTVETLVVSRKTPETLMVLGPGSLVGEMALFDGEARSATCTATSALKCAILTRDALERLTRNEPAIAARLMTAIGQRLAERLRQSDEKVRLYSHLVRTMQQEINVLMR